MYKHYPNSCIVERFRKYIIMNIGGGYMYEIKHGAVQSSARHDECNLGILE